MADAVETGRQDVDEEAADVLVRVQGLDFLSGATFGAVVLPFEGDAVVVEGD